MMPAESFTDFLEDYGNLFPPQLLYQEGDDFAEWQGRFKAALDGLRSDLPERLPLEVEEVDEIREETHTRKVLRYRITEITVGVANLLVPHDLKPGEKRPGVMVLHGHAGYGMDSVSGVQGIDCQEALDRSYALSAVNDGYVVLAPAWWGWVGRNGHCEELRPGRDKCNVIQTAAMIYGVDVTDLHIQDGQAATDVLASRPEVDPDRLACIGNSYGGRTTMWLAVYEPRFKALVPSGCMNTARERCGNLKGCGIQWMTGMLRYGDVPEVFSLLAPTPMQLQAGKADGLINETDREKIAETVARAYELAGAADNFEYYLHEGGHILIWDAAKRFIDQHL